MTLLAAPETAPVETVTTHTVFTNGIITVEVEDVMFPDSTPGTFSTVTVGQGKTAIAVPVMPVRGTAYVGLVRNYRHPVRKSSLELPRSGSRGLSLENASRAMVEQLGQTAVRRTERLGVIHPDTSVLTTEAEVWFARTAPALELPAFRDAATGTALEWHPAGGLPGLVRSGDITCAMTLAALALLHESGLLAAPQ